jgi:hypothetical protein
MPILPTFPHVLLQLQPIVPAMYGAIEAALQRTREFFEAEGMPIDRSLAPNLVRYYAKRLLAAEGQVAVEEEAMSTSDYELQPLPNNGLSLTYDRHEIRILKSDDGAMPVPGESQSRQEFWNWNGQQEFVFTYDNELTADSEEELPSLHLVVLWDVDSNYMLNKLLLGCPTSGNTTKESVSVYFLEEIPHPIEAIDLTQVTQDPPTVEDLDIQLQDVQERADGQQ